MTTSSFWYEDAGLEKRPRLEADAECDLVVIGSGIAGLSSAYEAARFGWRVVVIDRAETIGGVMTPRTTAHLATALDDYYHCLIDARGKDDARTYHESQVAAVNRIEAICRDEGIEADFTRLDGILVPAEAAHMSDLKKEYEACRTIGVEVEWLDQSPLPLPQGARALRFPNQARFHPLKYIRGLIQAVEGRGGRIHGGTVYVDHVEDDGGVTVETEAGPRIRAKAALFATNSPVNDKVAIHTKQIPDRTYAIAGPVPKGTVPRPADLGHARSLSLRPPPAAEWRRGSADRRRRGSSHRHGQRHGPALRPSRGLDPRALRLVRRGPIPLVRAGDGAH